MNPYQHIIDWLRTPEGEAWSEDRITRASTQQHPVRTGVTYRTTTCLTYSAPEGPVSLRGVFSIKGDG